MTYDDRDRVYAWLDAGNGYGLVPLDRAVLITLAEYTNSEKGVAWPGAELLATRWGVSIKGLEKSLHRLRGAGLIETQPAYGHCRARYRPVAARDF